TDIVCCAIAYDRCQACFGECGPAIRKRIKQASHSIVRDFRQRLCGNAECTGEVPIPIANALVEYACSRSHRNAAGRDAKQSPAKILSKTQPLTRRGKLVGTFLFQPKQLRRPIAWVETTASSLMQLCFVVIPAQECYLFGATSVGPGE